MPLIVEDTILVSLEETVDGNNGADIEIEIDIDIGNRPSIEDITTEDVPITEEERHIRNLLVRQKCLPILQKLLDVRDGWVFHCEILPDIVEPEIYGMPNYFEVITKPMHLLRVKEKLVALAYDDTASFHRDVVLVFDNVILYNDHFMALETTRSNPNLIEQERRWVDVAKRMKGDFETECERVVLCGE